VRSTVGVYGSKKPPSVNGAFPKLSQAFLLPVVAAYSIYPRVRAQGRELITQIGAKARISNLLGGRTQRKEASREKEENLPLSQVMRANDLKEDFCAFSGSDSTLFRHVALEFKNGTEMRLPV
jgi:hypothetical protein